MNGGNLSAEEYAYQAKQSAHRAEDAALSAQQSVSMLHTEVQELRKEMLRGFRELSGALELHRTPKLSRSDFNPSDTGSHFIVARETVEVLLEERETKEAAAAWRGTLGVVRRVAIGFALALSAGLAGYLVRHFLGKP